MGRYSFEAFKVGVNTANTIMFQLRAPAASDKIELLELAVSVEVAPTTGPTWRLMRTTALGTPTTTITPNPEDEDQITATPSRVDTAWSTPPTLAATGMRRYATPNAIGSGVVWTWWDKPFRIKAGGSLCIVNVAATGATLGQFGVYGVYDN